MTAIQTLTVCQLQDLHDRVYHKQNRELLRHCAIAISYVIGRWERCKPSAEYVVQYLNSEAS